MAQVRAVGNGAHPPASELPIAALSNPRATLALADAVLARSREPVELSYAGQARGIALREAGDVRAALRQLRRAHRDASGAGPSREADVAATLAVTLALAGRGDEGLARMKSALRLVRGAEAARIQVRLGSMLGELGMFAEAGHQLRDAARVLRRVGDDVWEARALLNLAMAAIELGDTRRAEQALARVDELLGGAPTLRYEAAVSSEYHGLAAVLEGRIPAALRYYDRARQSYAEAGTQAWEVASSQSAALLSVGLVEDALVSAEQSVAMLRGPNSSRLYRGRALLRACDAALACGQGELGGRYAREALTLFRGLRSGRRELLARAALTRARWQAGERSPRLLRDAVQIADEAGRLHMPEAVEVNLLVGELALHRADRPTARRHLARARRARTGHSDMSRVAGWRATALAAQDAGRPGAVLDACDHGLAVLEGHLATLGAIETRATATSHGLPLASLAVATAVGTGDPALMLRWVERWRSATLRLPPVAGSGDTHLAADLARLRLLRMRLADRTAPQQRNDRLEREVARLESSVRDRTHRASATGAIGRADVDAALEVALQAAGGTTLVEIFLAGDTVHVLVADRAGLRHHEAGQHADALRAVEFARFSLRRMTNRRVAARAREILPAQAQALQDAVLGEAAAELGDGPVVIVPPASLTSAPWGVLPALRERTLHIAASVDSWSTARAATPPAGAHTALIAGPDLPQAVAEVDVLADMYPAARVVRTGSAGAEQVLATLEGAALAHVAAHGSFRSDNPMFSALHLDDGPLTVYDLQTLRRAPHRLVLSCCDSGTVSPAGADEALGLASALVPLGMAGMIAAAVPVSDLAAVPFAQRLHTGLRAGASTAEALRDARLDADQPLSYAIAHSFVAYGAG
ncbi:CHAT domain-containing protein [uncultured Jatrophihabitans sp.]|uniref:CHAT domain-containing protein n=1 Tax=uncultured Jatrophihabitans sp. TaxID=1610747 RepID=UPI0035CA6A27